MCGLLFLQQVSAEKGVSPPEFERIVSRQKWRGPDAQRVVSIDNGRFLLGHNRLAIIDPVSRSNQPLFCRNGRYAIVFNGEIYNHKEIRRLLPVEFLTQSDTETILEGYIHFGERIFEMLDGMFAVVILDCATRDWVAARDPFGIKPLFVARRGETVILGSEAAIIASLTRATPSLESVAEWRAIRRPMPGKSFFEGVDEVLPGTILRKDGRVKSHWELRESPERYSQERFEELLVSSVKRHELSDVKNVSLLSGGLDSAVITAISSVVLCYCIGLDGNSEVEGARETAAALGRQLRALTVDIDELRDTWRMLTRLRGEPLSVPNEGLIYQVCRAMAPDEKVVLTGEGADELLFGYDKIFTWAAQEPWVGIEDFLARYGYSRSTSTTSRFEDYVDSLRRGKSNIEFVEDFFYRVHLPGLLRRMDFGSMAASKEARVPFVTKDLVSYMYRRPPAVKLSGGRSKLPLRGLAEKLGLYGALSRKKIGFSAALDPTRKRFDEYAEFQDCVLGELAW